MDATTNHVTTSGFAYDANGNTTSIPSTPQNINLTYDVENRTGGTWYDQQNQPLDRAGAWNLYGLRGERLGTYTYSVSWTSYPQGSGLIWLATVTQTQASRNVYFGGRLIQSNGTTVARDPTGSVRANENGETFEYYPYGEEVTVKNPQDREKFGTYTRESSTGLDYADQRYYASVYGRFNTPDRYQASAGPADPGSWNRYSYVQGDPINNRDRSGQCVEDTAGDFWDGPQEAYAEDVEYTEGSCFGDQTFLSLYYTIGATLNGVFLQAPAGGDSGGNGGDNSHPVILFERAAFGTPGNHTYLDISETIGGTTVLDDVLEGDPTNKHPPFRNPFSGRWGSLIGYDEPVALGVFQGATNPSTNTRLASDTGGRDVCADVFKLKGEVGLYDLGQKVPYKPIPTKGCYNSNSFTFTLLYDIGLVNRNGFGVFPDPPGWNPGWGKFVPGL